jgi:hypothetical protein
LTDAIDWCRSWLYTPSPRDAGMPRTLVLQGIKPPDCSFLIDRITKVIFDLKNEMNLMTFSGL